MVLHMDAPFGGEKYFMARKKNELLPGMRRKGASIEYRFSIEGTRYSVCGATSEECRDKEYNIRKEIEAGKRKKPARPAAQEMEDYIDKWIELKKSKKKLKPSTLRTYRKLISRICRQVINDSGVTFGELRLGKVTADDIENLQRSLQSDGLHSRTVNDSIYLLKQVFDSAVNREDIRRNPINGVEPVGRTEPPARDTIHRSLTRGEVDTFMKAAKDSWFYPLYIFLLNTGLRVGEAGALYLRDISEESINVHKTVTRTETGYTIAEQTKTEAGLRAVEMRPEAWQAVRMQRRYNEAVNPDKASIIDYPVFTLPRGGVIRPDRVNTDIKKICEKTGIEVFTCHAFRATFTSRCIASGVNVKILMEQLGHTNVEMTLGLYGHADKDQSRSQILAVNV